MAYEDQKDGNERDDSESNKNLSGVVLSLPHNGKPGNTDERSKEDQMKLIN